MPSSTELTRVDPEGCGCTDCIVGYSKPIDTCTQEQLVMLHFGVLTNASGCEVTAEITVSYQ